MSITYRGLQPQEFSAALQIRIEVFVEEQKVPLEEEHDMYDQTAQHFGVFLDERMVGTGRLILMGNIGKIGRVAILREFRGRGLGCALIRTIIDTAKRQGVVEFILDAQIQALDFYQKLGFEAEGDLFLDGGIPHRTMRYRTINSVEVEQ